jgi:Domain of unknown function (DUF4391)
MMLERLFEALALPASARMDRRVPKAMLADHGATGVGDRRLVELGIERLRWRATLKPGTVGVPAFADEGREYAEIAVLTLELRAGANAVRLAKIAHAAIPYPLILIIGDGEGAALSVAPKRRHERQADRFVVDRLVTAPALAEPADDAAAAFIASLAVAGLPAMNLWSLYQGIADRIEAYASASITGNFRLMADPDEAVARRAALIIHSEKTCELLRLRRNAKLEKRLSNRLALAQQISSIEHDIASIITALQ